MPALHKTEHRTRCVCVLAHADELATINALFYETYLWCLYVLRISKGLLCKNTHVRELMLGGQVPNFSPAVAIRKRLSGASRVIAACDAICVFA